MHAQLWFHETMRALARISSRKLTLDVYMKLFKVTLEGVLLVSIDKERAVPS